MSSTHQASRRPSLVGALADGSAGVWIRVLASLGTAFLLVSIACLSSYALSAWFGGGSPATMRVEEEIVLTCFLTCGVAYLGFLFWIWSRHRRNRGIWLGAIATVAIWGAAIVLMLAIDLAPLRDEEVLIIAVCTGAIAATLGVWVWLYWRYSGGRALRDEAGVIDLRCPQCGYHMAGLKEARCPECGTEFTLDELVGRQDFELLRRSGDAAGTGSRGQRLASGGPD